MEKKTVLVTGIGGNVGQGIIRNIREMGYPIRIVGTNISESSAGNHLVDAFYMVPYGYENEFIPLLKSIVEKEGVDLIIPSTDYEAYYLSLNAAEFTCKLAVSGIEATEKYLDKYLTWQLHEKHDIPFAESVLPSAYNDNFDLAIAKPRKGRGSKGIIKNITDKAQIHALKDDEYMIQRMYEGIEVTTAVYVRYFDNLLHGIITMERSLENGATTYCKVVKDYDNNFNLLANKIISSVDIKGSFNIQSIVTNNGDIYPFEVNCRISGTNSIRAHLGFNDVKYTIQELLYLDRPDNVKVIEGYAFRFLTDVIYVGNEENMKGNNDDKFIVF